MQGSLHFIGAIVEGTASSHGQQLYKIGSPYYYTAHIILKHNMGGALNADKLSDWLLRAYRITSLCLFRFSSCCIKMYIKK